MKLLHYVEIENFKRYGDVQRLELVDACDPEEFNGDVKAKLDALLKLLS